MPWLSLIIDFSERYTIIKIRLNLGMLSPVFRIINKYMLIEFGALCYIVYNLLINENLNPGEVSILMVFENMAYLLATLGFVLMLVCFNTTKKLIREKSIKAIGKDLLNLLLIPVFLLSSGGLAVLFIIVLSNELITGFFSSYLCGENPVNCTFKIFGILDRGLIFEKSVLDGLNNLYGNVLMNSFWLMFVSFFLYMTFEFLSNRKVFQIDKKLREFYFSLAATRIIIIPVLSLISCIIWVLIDAVSPGSIWQNLFIMLVVFRLGVFFFMLLTANVLKESYAENEQKALKKFVSKFRAKVSLAKKNNEPTSHPEKSE